MSDTRGECSVDSITGGNQESLIAPVPSDGAPAAAALLAGGLMSGCGGNSPAAPPAAPPPSIPPSIPPTSPPPLEPPPAPGPGPAPQPPAPPTAVQASRFLAQASMGATREDIARVQAIGYAGWIDEQARMASPTSRWDWLMANGFNALIHRPGEGGADACQWRALLSAPDTLRQRMTFALSEILVAGVTGFFGEGWMAFSTAAYLDLLQAHAFGNFRTLLQQVTLSAPMGEFLTYRGNAKFDPGTGAMPDENFAREVMQLFTIGLVPLNLDGMPRLDSAQQETYSLADITGLARVFTGWDYDLAGGDASTPDFKRRPMIQNAALHESGSKAFLGTTIPAGTDGATSLTLALDAIFAHANVAPFISRQLIQRLVCSNPSPAYVGRVATVFNNDGTGTKGNLRAVLEAILLDDEARNEARLGDPTFGKQREPILRFTAWARAFNASSPSGAWAIGNTSDPGSRLSQSPLRSPTVFNFFRPGYVPPNSAIANAGIVAPEFQLTNESSVVGYLNFMQTVVSRGVVDVKADYSSLMPLADNAQALLDDLNLLLAAGQLSAPTVALIKGGLDGMPLGTDAARLNRIYAALVMVMAAPEFIVQK